MAALAHHSWPGNVRELQNFIERSVILSKGPVLNGSQWDLTCAQMISAPVTLEDAERSHILQTLQQTEGVVGGPNGAAARLGLPRTTLISKMRRLGITFGRGAALPDATSSRPATSRPRRVNRPRRRALPRHRRPLKPCHSSHCTRPARQWPPPTGSEIDRCRACCGQSARLARDISSPRGHRAWCS